MKSTDLPKKSQPNATADAQAAAAVAPPTPEMAPVPLPPTFAQILWKAVSSESFFEKAVLLLLTALLSGLVIPMVVSSIQATRSRNESILQAQAKLYDELADTMLRYESLALDVSWFKGKEANSEEMHEQAFLRYNQRTVDLVSQWRVQAAKAQTLVSPASSEKITKFLARVFKEQDTPINELHRSKAGEEEWTKQHQRSIDMLMDTNDLIAEIARDLHLSKSNLR